MDHQTAMTYYDFAIQTGASQLVKMAIAIFVFIMLVRLFNKLTGNRFNVWLKRAVDDGGLGGGVYFGLRLLALAILIAKYL